MKIEKPINSAAAATTTAAAAAVDTASGSEPRALYHVYQKLNRLRDLIAAGAYPNADHLAKKMEISLRTVKRYLDNLRQCGAPLENDRRRGGYYFTDPYWQLPPMKLSEGDLLAFFIAEQSLKSTGQTNEAAQLRRSLSRLASFLPTEVSINLTALAASVSFQNLPFAAAPPETLALLTESSVNQQIITFDYYSPHINYALIVKPAFCAASLNRISSQMNNLPLGFSLHQTSAAAN